MLLPEVAAITNTAWLIDVAAGDKILLYDI
jgi:hypothetical protein